MSGLGTLPPGVHQPQREDHDEDHHLDQCERAEALETDRPREDEDGLHVEHHEEQRVDVVPDVRLAEAGDRVRAGLVGDVLLVLRPVGTEEPPDAEHGAEHPRRRGGKHRDREIGLVVRRHRATPRPRE